MSQFLISQQVSNPIKGSAEKIALGGFLSEFCVAL